MKLTTWNSLSVFALKESVTWIADMVYAATDFLKSGASDRRIAMVAETAPIAWKTGPKSVSQSMPHAVYQQIEAADATPAESYGVSLWSSFAPRSFGGKH